ncbi:hypothetical protein [Caulobacter rhizosphaerae]|jgi:hypothetical protein|uniref:hypothetical protein n=1 Tax=Caulobacter rhizosphaerae TaxID=2010972 RepID=UPI0013D22295|nr:hypothetical protein [Caulobacter rhizosphaerae]GGL09492.1 hypothetical protein GCM10010983_03220 [Caulobacter rhizosphaerae]
MDPDRRRLLAAGLFLALGGCAGRGGVTLVVRPGLETGELETLRGAVAGPAALVLKVESTGCTTKADFVFYVGHDGREKTVSFARKRLDVCKTAPSVTEVSFSYDELGLAGAGRVRLLNPVN